MHIFQTFKVPSLPNHTLRCITIRVHETSQPIIHCDAYADFVPARVGQMSEWLTRTREVSRHFECKEKLVALLLSSLFEWNKSPLSLILANISLVISSSKRLENDIDFQILLKTWCNHLSSYEILKQGLGMTVNACFIYSMEICRKLHENVHYIIVSNH